MSFSLATYGPTGANYAPLAYHWTTVFPVHPALKRSCHAMIAYSRSGVSGTVDVFAILGGWSVSRGRCNDVWETLDRGQTWHCVSESAAWSPRSQFSALSSSDGSTIFVIGGDDGDYRSDVWVSKDYCRTFTQITRSAPFKGRAAFSACLLPVSGHLLIACGRTVGEPVAVLNDVWLSKDGGESWIQLWLHAPFPARSGSPLISGFVNSHEEKRCEDGRKKRRRRTSPTRRTCRIVLACGSAGGRSTLGDVWISDDEGRSWTEVSSTDDHHYHYKGEAFEHLEISTEPERPRTATKRPPKAAPETPTVEISDSVPPVIIAEGAAPVEEYSFFPIAARPESIGPVENFGRLVQELSGGKTESPKKKKTGFDAERLKQAIQSIVKSTGPLAKLSEMFTYDMTLIDKEIIQAESEICRSQLRIENEERAAEDKLTPLRRELEDVELQISEIRKEIKDARNRIIAKEAEINNSLEMMICGK